MAQKKNFKRFFEKRGYKVARVKKNRSLLDRLIWWREPSNGYTIWIDDAVGAAEFYSTILEAQLTKVIFRQEKHNAYS